MAIQQQKISEVISRLEQIKDKNGDLPVYIEYDLQYQTIKDYQFKIKEDRSGKFVLITDG
jgi:hypothetical protein